MGQFTKVADLMRFDRPVYRKVGSDVVYLYVWADTLNWNWIIGPSYTSSQGGVRSTTGFQSREPECPEGAAGWEAAVGVAWVKTYPIKVAQTAVGN